MTNENKVFDFAEQNKVGKKGEQFVKKHWPVPLRKLEGKGPDFLDLDGNLLEVKTDSYDMEKSVNFFVEKYSDLNKRKPGGPWQAIEKGSTVFIYLFITNKTWYVFKDIPALVAKLEVLTEKMGMVYIKNRAWTTAGYKIKRASLADLYEEKVFGSKAKEKKRVEVD